MQLNFNQTRMWNLCRIKKGGNTLGAGKKEGVWGRNFCLPCLSSPKTFCKLFRASKQLLGFSFFCKDSPNFFVQGAPLSKHRSMACYKPRLFEFQTHFLPSHLKVRLHFVQEQVVKYLPAYFLPFNNVEVSKFSSKKMTIPHTF